jgi:hypothetical protein
MDSFSKSHHVLLQRFCSRESVPFDDPFWFEIAHAEEHLLSTPQPFLDFLRPYCAQLAANNAVTHNFGCLALHAADQLSSLAVESSAAAIKDACNSCALLNAFTAHLLSLVPGSLHDVFVAPANSGDSRDVLGLLVQACFHEITCSLQDDRHYPVLVASLLLCITICSVQLHCKGACMPGNPILLLVYGNCHEPTSRHDEMKLTECVRE